MFRFAWLILFVLGSGEVRPQSFAHKDWQLACDNTGTCRAVGYHGADDDRAMAVLVERRAGPGTSVDMAVMLGSRDDDPALPSQVALRVGPRSLGAVHLSTTAGTGRLSDEQAAAVLKAVLSSDEASWSDGRRRWRVSGQGARAVLLKMDDWQGRVGTAGALVRRGAAPEERAAAPRPVPVVRVPRLAPRQPGDAALGERLRGELQRDSGCAEAAEHREAIEVRRLSPSKILVSTLCWRAAYNAGLGFWVANATPPFEPRLVTANGSDHESGVIRAAHKGRGTGDCGSLDEWAWDGEAFVHARSSTTGDCRGVAPGGVWELPTLVADIRRDPN